MSLLVSPFRSTESEFGKRRVWNESDLVHDLELAPLLHCMGASDTVIERSVSSVLFDTVSIGIEDVLRRQEAVKDAIANADSIRRLYAVAVDVEARRKDYWDGFFSRTPSSMLFDATRMLDLHLDTVIQLQSLLRPMARSFASAAFSELIAWLDGTFDAAFVENARRMLREVDSDRGTLLGAGLGVANGVQDVTHLRTRKKRPNLFERMLRRGPRAVTFRVHERDEAGMRILSDIRNLGLARTAVVMTRVAETLRRFFDDLRRELGFCVGCCNLFERLAGLGIPVCYPTPAPAGSRGLTFEGLRHPSLALRTGTTVVGNDAVLDGADMVVVTGANQGGKSMFLKALGAAHVMMRAGMFVAAEKLVAELGTGVVTHFRSGEDRTLRHGKLDEELERLSTIVEHLEPDAVVLCNETFASTNEREGSALAHHVFEALCDAHIRVFFVTHFFEFARRMADGVSSAIRILRAERLDDGRRTYRIVASRPMATSFAEDVYRDVFGEGGRA